MKLVENTQLTSIAPYSAYKTNILYIYLYIYIGFCLYQFLTSTLCHSCGFACQFVSLPWLFPLRGWGSITMTFLGKFAYIWFSILSCYVSISVPYGDWERRWFEQYMSYLQVCLAVEGTKNVSWPWPWLFPL